MTSYLFLLTIGPVQDFIAAARRTRDLWAGSQLLSDLSRAAALYIKTNQQENEDALIFPSSSSENEGFKKHDVVNRILAKVDVGDIKAFGDQLENDIRDKFRNMYREVLQKFPDSHFDRATAEKHLEDLLEINWAAVEFNGDNYKDAREQLEHVLAARKNTRDFEQTDWSKEGKLRSSIDGQRESVIDKSLYVQRGDDDATKKKKLNTLWNDYHISGAEQLSGVDLFKRWYKPELANSQEDDFPSTSHIAALPFIWRYVRATSQNAYDSQQEETFNKAIEAYAKKLEEIQRKVNIKEKVTHQSSRFVHFMPYDASILFDSRLREITDSDELKSRQSQELGDAREELKNFYQQLKTTDRPSPYYAVLLADGDAMGQAIDKLAEQRNEQGKEIGLKLHQQFSKRLDVFASAVRNIVESHWGALIYSGGDDVLALVPLHSLLACAKALHDRFDEAWLGEKEDPKPPQNEELWSALHGGKITPPTLSMGIAIAHYMEPLSDTLKLARDAEKKAKSFPGVKDQAIPAKNALAITLSKRSGSDRTIVGSWSGEFFQHINDLIQLYRTDNIPDGYAFELEDLSLRLGSKIDPAILRAEAKRIAKRKLEGKDSNELLKLAEKLPATKSEDTFAWNIDMFVNELVIASELARALGPIVT